MALELIEFYDGDAWRDGKRLKLRPRQIRILETLYVNTFYPRPKDLKQCRCLRVHFSKIRAEFRANGIPLLILAIRRRGWKLLNAWEPAR